MVIVSCRKRFHPSNSFHKWLVSLRPWRVFFFLFYFYFGDNWKSDEQLQRDLWTLLRSTTTRMNVVNVAHLPISSKRPWNLWNLTNIFGSSNIRLHKMKPIWEDQIDIWMFDIAHFGKLLSLTVIHGRWFWHFICHMSLWYASLKTIFTR